MGCGRRGEVARFPVWSVQVGLSDNDTNAAASAATRRTFGLIALSALASIGALLMTLRAVEAKAALATMKSDFVSAVSTCINNTGPGLGIVNATMVPVSEPGKWLLILAMLLGRLEIFTLLVVFTPAFWRK